MKLTLLTLLLLMMALPTWAQPELTEEDEILRFTIVDYRPTDRSYVAEIMTDEAYDLILLDCQSFFNGINVFENQGENAVPLFTVFLEPQECEEIHEFLLSNLEDDQISCMELDLTNYDYYLSTGRENCQ